MGQFRFAIPRDQSQALQLWDTAYICGIEGVPWEGHVSLEDGILTVRRGVDDSGRLFVPYPVGPDGPLATLSTCSLRQTGRTRDKAGSEGPHLLPLELARGECFRLRSQADQWRQSGLMLDQVQSQQLDDATERFLRAATERGSIQAVSHKSDEAIYHLVAASDMLADCYNHQALAYRKQNERQLGTLLGASVAPGAIPDLVGGSPQSQQFQTAFNSIGISLAWGSVETGEGKVDFGPFDEMFDWAAAAGLRVVAGPLFDFHATMLPQWLYLYEDDFTSLVESIESYVERVVRRYSGRVGLWHAAAGLNTPGPLQLDEEQVMRLAVAVIHTIRRVDPRTPVLISVDLPWGEYLGTDREGISPLHFADALIRSNLGVAGIGLELRMNYTSNGSLPRTLLDFGQQIDRWSTLGLPLLAQLVMPASGGPDPLAQRAGEVIPLGAAGRTNADLQAKLAMRWVHMMLAKGVVQGVLWDGWDDRFQHSMPHSGLIDGQGKPRPLLGALARLRRDLLT